MASITLEELHAYHAIDREIFSRLVKSLLRDPAESLLVMATWLWLEKKGCPNIIVKMIGLSNILVNALVDEVVMCLKCLESNTLSIFSNAGNNILLTARIMENNISLEMFYHNKFSAITGIKNFLNTVCARIFTDILQHVLPTTTRSTSVEGALVIPGFPHPIFGDITITPRSLDFHYPIGELWGWDPNNNASEDDRTMFLTFSRGFPVTKEEVTQLFSRLHGACVVSVEMQENVPSNEQPLFARMILDSITAVDRILNGRHIAKFRINGKHIWARKYERRD